MVRHLFILFVGVFFCSTSVILIKLSQVHPMLVAGWRLVMASLLLSPLFFRGIRKHPGVYSWTHFRQSALPGLFLSLHFMSWAHGARLTIASNASLIVNMVPIAMPALLWAFAGEKIRKTEALATGVAMSGVALLVLSDFKWHPNNVTGDLICFGSMLLFAGYLALGRRNRHFPDLWLYLVPLYLVAGLVSFAATAVFYSVGLIDPDWALPKREVVILLGLAVMPTILGHSLINRSMHHLRGQLVSLCNLGQFIFASLVAWRLWGEVPATFFYVSAGLIVGGAWFAIRGSLARSD